MIGGEILKKKIRLAIAGLVISMILLGAAFAVLWNTRQFSNMGSIKATGIIGIYWDGALTQNASDTTADWGEYVAMQTKNKTLWIVNEGNVLTYVGWRQNGMTHVGGFLLYWWNQFQ